jgi:plasmid stabilization system protein ParE
MKRIQPAWIIFVAGSACVLAVWGSYGVATLGRSVEKWGAFGDKFGALNCLFAGLGYIAIVATLIYHHHESAAKEREIAALMERLEQTASALGDQAEQGRRQVRIQANIAMFEHWMVRYQHHAQHGPPDAHREAWGRVQHYRERIEADTEH